MLKYETYKISLGQEGMNLTRTGLIVLISVIFVAGAGTAYAGIVLPMITFDANTITTGTAQFDSDVNIDGILSGQTIDAVNDDITSLQLMFPLKDVVVVNRGDGDISVLLGNGDGTFVRTDVAVGNTPQSVAIGDLNNDGDQDVIVTNQNDNDISILLGNGDGTFAAQPDVAVGGLPISVAIGNLNNDGDQDVVVTNNSDDDISVLLGNGDGTFTAQPDVAVGISPFSVAIGDLNS